MAVVAVTNPKGGVGKSTLSTNMAGYFAREGGSVVLGDVDRQQSSRLWLQQRPEAARPIVRWNISADDMERPPRDVTHAVLDTPAGLHGKLLKEVLKLADKIVVPLQASVFDIFATQEFLSELAEHRHAQGVQVGIVGMRVDGRTLASEQLHHFIEGLGLPVLGYLRDTQNYVHLAAHGLSVFDVAPGRVARDLEQWQGICDWLDA
ncbi:ParA family protein [Diaphorobacter sp. HDW4A]|uniref:ParA family protein n=1 Tax=Diaphorobacter sp. HDW4A TaxID=2714924 RepID=UPI0014090B30|nr:ParA family protein [Diaphorobacter sp. HDW4A]QIL83476.1 ParA family protein [Diaphorobacter sp. HDW4A]